MNRHKQQTRRKNQTEANLKKEMKGRDKTMKLRILTVPVLIALTITTALTPVARAKTPVASDRLGSVPPLPRWPVDLNVGDLQMEAEFEQQVIGLAVSSAGRVFVSFPRNGIDTVKISVAEVINGSRPGNGEGFVQPVAYPNEAINTLDPTAPSNDFLSAHGVCVDSRARLMGMTVGHSVA